MKTWIAGLLIIAGVFCIAVSATILVSFYLNLWPYGDFAFLAIFLLLLCLGVAIVTFTYLEWTAQLEKRIEKKIKQYIAKTRS